MTPKWSYFHSLTTQKGNIKVIVCLKAKKKIYWATIQNLLHKTHYSKSPYFVTRSIFMAWKIIEIHLLGWLILYRFGWLNFTDIKNSRKVFVKKLKNYLLDKNWTFNIVQENIYTIFCWGFLFAKFCVDTNGKMMALSFFQEKALGKPPAGRKEA